MDIESLVFGAVGALFTVYVAKQEIIPEFRPLFDVADAQVEIKQLRQHIQKTQDEIDKAHVVLQQESEGVLDRLQLLINTSQSELAADRARLRSKERELMTSQLLSRCLGFAAYILLGGVFASLLADKVDVEGLTGDASTAIKALVIGASWTTYLSAIGVRAGQDKADERIEALKSEVTAKIAAMKDEVTPKIRNAVSSAETAKEVEQPVLAPQVAAALADQFDQMSLAVQQDLDLTRKMVRKDVKGLL